MRRIDIELEVQDLDPSLAEELRQALVGVADDLAGIAQRHVTEAMPQHLDRPTPFTQRGIGMRPADPSSEAPESVVDVLPLQREWLSYEILGGVRRGGDYATTRLGPLVPGPDAPRDAYGNLPRTYVRTVLSQPGVAWVTLKGGSGLPVLIRRRGTGRVEILARIIREARYQPKLPFYDLVDEAVADHVDAVLADRLAFLSR